MLSTIAFYGIGLAFVGAMVLLCLFFKGKAEKAECATKYNLCSLGYALLSAFFGALAVVCIMSLFKMPLPF